MYCLIYCLVVTPNTIRYFDFIVILTCSIFLVCCATSGLGPSSSNRLANDPAVLKFFSLKNMLHAVRRVRIWEAIQ